MGYIYFRPIIQRLLLQSSKERNFGWNPEKTVIIPLYLLLKDFSFFLFSFPVQYNIIPNASINPSFVVTTSFFKFITPDPVSENQSVRIQLGKTEKSHIFQRTPFLMDTQ
jgi:hypothetical protein